MSEIRILLVDDDRTTRELLSNVLLKVGTVDQAEDLYEALNLLDESYYELLITDFCLGHDSGIHLARYIQQNRLTTEVMLITGHGSDEIMEEAVELGVSHYIQKPINIPEFMSFVNQAIHNNLFNKKTFDLVNIRFCKEAPPLRDHLINVIWIQKHLQLLSRAVNALQTVRFFLQEQLNINGADLAIVGIQCFNTLRLYACGTDSPDVVYANLLQHWNRGAMATSGWSREKFTDDRISPIFIESPLSKTLHESNELCEHALITPLSMMGESFGFFALLSLDNEITSEAKTLFYSLPPLISPVIYRDILEERVKQQAMTDGLTGIANRRMFDESILREVQQVIRYDRSLSFLMIDIDFFKKVNDTFGHLLGDMVLCDLVKRVGRLIRGGDLFSRYGGEEFVLLLPDTSTDGALQLAERIRQTIGSEPFTDGTISVPYTVSIGVSTYAHKSGESVMLVAKDIVQDLISRGDSALYEAKRTGRDKVVFLGEANG